jgi:hypothetical protein
MASDNRNSSTNGSYNDSSDNSDRSDNSVVVANSNNDSSNRSVNIDNSVTDTSSAVGSARTSSVFGDGALVASANLSSYVTGSSVTFHGTGGDGGQSTDNSINTGGSSFQNFAGMQALNQNTGVGASQNANVSVAAQTGNITM